MFQPTLKRFAKIHTGSVSYTSKKEKDKLIFGTSGINSLESSFISYKQLISINKILIILIKSFKGKFWFRISPIIPITKKSVGMRMGKGSGKVSYWTCKVKKNTILLEIDGVPKNSTKKLLKISQDRLPIKSEIISNLVY
jgi:large subunit ribosomal protein L16